MTTQETEILVIKGTEHEIEIHCAFHEIVPLASIKENPDNANKHDSDQISDFAKGLTYHGIRHPIIISTRNGKMAAGHGRKMAALKLGLKEFPVVYQDFKDEDAERSFLHFDNAISQRSSMDLSIVNDQMKLYDPSFDLDFLGFKDFTLDFAEKGFDPTDSVEAEKEQKKCPHCGEAL
ncbi:MAG TPA: ParB N-terminal domain-containing protein [Ignavibacteriaceae bacterium]